AAVTRRKETSGGLPPDGGGPAEGNRKENQRAPPMESPEATRPPPPDPGRREKEDGVRWTMSWTIARDILLTGTGITVILVQAFSGHPSDIVLAAGLALTVPS